MTISLSNIDVFINWYYVTDRKKTNHDMNYCSTSFLPSPSPSPSFYSCRTSLGSLEKGIVKGK